MKKVLLLFVSATLIVNVYGQQDPQFTQFMYDRLSINPGYAGSQDAFCATLLGRQQWSGFNGQPNTGLLNVSGPIPSIKSGIGLSVMLDEIGPQSTTTLRLSYAYHIKLGGATKLGLGIGLGFINSSITSNWVAYDYVDGSAPQLGVGIGDNGIPQLGQSAGTFDANFGIYIHNPKYYIGLSASHLNEGDLSEMNIQVARHYYFMAGYDFDLSSKWKLTPHVLVKSDLASTQFDGNLTVMYDNSLWLGASYRLEDAIAPMAGYQFNFTGGKSTLRLGYSYDITTSELNNYSSGSHELMLSYCYTIAKPLPKRVYKNPRFL